MSISEQIRIMVREMEKEIKLRLLRLNKKQVDLLPELKKRGFEKACKETLSRCISGSDMGPQACRMREVIYNIIAEWEALE